MHIVKDVKIKDNNKNRTDILISYKKIEFINQEAVMEYANETMKLLYERGSCRTFLDKKIDDKIIDDIIGAGIHSATGGNLQAYSIIKIHSPEQKKYLVEKCDMQPLVERAPLNLLFCMDWRRTGRWAEAQNAPYVALKSAKHFWIGFQDVIIAAQSICTAADSYGIGNVYIGTVESCFEEITQLCKLPEGVMPIVLISFGYPDREITPAKKIMHNAVVHDGVYKDMEINELCRAYDEKYKGKSYPASDKNINTFREVTAKVYGEEKAEQMIKGIEEKGSINMAQMYFGLHYRADWSCAANSEMIEALKSQGYTWTDGEDFPK